MHHEQRALFTSARVPSAVPGQVLIFTTYLSEVLEGKHALRVL